MRLAGQHPVRQVNQNDHWVKRGGSGWEQPPRNGHSSAAEEAQKIILAPSNLALAGRRQPQQKLKAHVIIRNYIFWLINCNPRTPRTNFWLSFLLSLSLSLIGSFFQERLTSHGGIGLSGGSPAYTTHSGGHTGRNGPTSGHGASHGGSHGPGPTMHHQTLQSDFQPPYFPPPFHHTTQSPPQQQVSQSWTWLTNLDELIN